MKTRSIWLGAALVSVFVAVAVGFVVMKRSDSSQGRPETVRIEKGDLILSIPATGVIEPRFSVEIKSKASGEISKILAEEGDAVEKGEVIIEIDPKIEKSGVRRAAADVMVAAAAVKKGEIFLEKARMAKTRQEKLHEKGLISDVEIEDGAHEAALREADLSLAQAEYLRAQEVLSEAEERLRETRVVSPLSGVILTLDVERGQLISSGMSSFSHGTPLAVVGDLSEVRIRAEVDETDAREAAVHQEALMPFDASPEKSYRGRVIRVAPLARTKNDLAVITLFLSIEGLVDPADDALSPQLRPGLSADVEVITQRLSGIHLLAREALHQQEGKWGVSVLAGEAVSFHEVVTGASDGERIEIKTDLPVGTQVVMGGRDASKAPSRGPDGVRP